MEVINLKTVKLERKGDAIVITHKRTSMKAMSTDKQLEAWCIRQLRGELTPNKESK